MAVRGEGKRRVRVSKNKKKSWSKFCDVQDVEEYLEEKRFEERIGGSISEKTDAELFFVQTTTEPSENCKLKKTLKCHQSIGSFTKVAPPVNINVNRYSKKIKNALNRATERKFKKLLSKTNPPKKDEEENVQNGGLYTSEICDLWSSKKEEIDPEIEEYVNYRDEITKKKNPKVPLHRYQKPSLLPSVEVPHAGASYNPTHDDHQELLHEALAVEEKKQREEFHLKRVLNDMFPTKDKAPTEESVLLEMSQGLFDDSDPEEENENYSPFTTRNPPVSAEDRLTKSRKRRRKELKEEALKRAVEKKNKQRLHDIYRLRSIKKQINREKEISEEKQKITCERQIDNMYKPRKISKFKYEPPELEIKLSEELTGSLRKLKVEGNLLEDRYKSLMRRNLIEPRIKQKMKRKYKLKVQVKRSHRNFV